ncbi:MAG: Kelch repeat-containing protein, partial [Bryobacteraceae bacterium]
PVGPGVFATGGVAAAAALRVAADESRVISLVADGVESGGEGEQLYLLLFGTGIRNARSVTVAVAGTATAVLGVAPQPETPGLDQVNIGPLPQSLAGRGSVEILLTADGLRANPATANFRGPAPAQWGTRAQLPEANSEMAVADLDGKIYVLGGYPANRISVATVQVYDPSADRWSLTTPLPVAINHPMSVSVNGKLYFIGGQLTANGGFVDTVYEYDPATAVWTTRARMPTERSAGAAAVIDGKIYVAGGRPPRGADFAVYDPAADRWQALPNLPTQRNHLIAGAIGGKFYVLGGRFEGGFTSPQSDAVEIYDPVSGVWSRGAAMPKPRGGINGVVALGCLHVLGGEGSSADPNGVYPDHDVYNPVSNTWSSLGRMPIPVHGVTGASYLNGLIYLPGGGTQEGGSSGGRQHQVYRPAVSCR